MKDWMIVELERKVAYLQQIARKQLDGYKEVWDIEEQWEYWGSKLTPDLWSMLGRSSSCSMFVQVVIVCLEYSNITFPS